MTFSTEHRKKMQGFTLIEVMVVLSILALVAILAYSFFGNTMKSDDMNDATSFI